MAIATPPGGYDYQFVNAPHNLVVCVVCYLPSRDPHLTECCGHIICKSCVDQIKASRYNACPMCKDEIFKTVSNKQIDREVKSLHVYCTNKEKGCEWQGELNYVINHLGNSDGCQFEEVKCSNECGKMIERRYLTSHVETECPRHKETQLEIGELPQTVKNSSSTQPSGSYDPQQEIIAKLEQAKAENKTIKLSYTSVLFTGASGVGKTCLLNKLNKEPLSLHHNSTGVMESKHTICINTAAVIKSDEGLYWTDLNYDMMIVQLRKHLDDLQLSSTKSTAHLEKVASGENLMKVEADFAKADASNAPSLGDVWRIINFLDTGGQPEFVNLLPAVSSSVAITFVVFNLSQRLHDRVYIQHNVKGDPSFEPYYLDCTNLEFIRRLIVSSRNFNQTIKPLPPSVQIVEDDTASKMCCVGTHSASPVSENMIKEFDKQLSILASELKLLFWSSPKPELRRIFPVEMFPSGQDKSSESIIEVICEKVKEEVEGRKCCNVPISWLIFLLKLQKHCDVKKVHYISYQEAVGIWDNENFSQGAPGSDVQSNNDDRTHSVVHEVLLFFHIIGIFLYYHNVKGIRDFVFIDRQWLFEKLTDLVDIKFTQGCAIISKKDVRAEHVEKFTQEGILNIKIIEKLKINLGSDIQPVFFIHLLDHLNVVAPVDLKLKDYFMPCILPTFSPSTSSVNFDNLYGPVRCAPLLVGLKNGPMPQGFFCLMIVELMKSLPADWGRLFPSTSEQQHVYSNLIPFLTSSGHFINLFYRIGFLEVQVRHTEPQPNIHSDVFSKLASALCNVFGHLKQDKEQVCFGFYCSCGKFANPMGYKLTVSTQNIFCVQHHVTKVTEDHRVWLQEIKRPPDIHDSSKQETHQKEPSMKWLHQLVIPEISYCWEMVADYLDYPRSKKKEIADRQHCDPYQCCTELMEDWLTSDRGVSPKSWLTLLSVLKEIQGLSRISLSIQQRLLKEGLL